MWARSHTSGLMISMCWDSTSASLSGATRASVRSLASARASAVGDSRIYPRLQSAPLPPDVDHLAHRRGAPRDAAVERADGELEPARLELLELGHQRMEAATLLVDQHDVAGRDALR